MNLDALFPSAGDHAIQNVVFAIEWREPLGAKEAHELKGRIQQRLAQFTVFKPHQTMMLNITAGVPSPAVASPSETGFVFETATLFGESPKRAINVTAEQSTLTVNDYTRWKDVKAEVDKYIAALIGAIGGKQRALQAVALQYSDVFHWKAAPEDLAIGQVFNKGTRYLVPNVFTQNSFWHCTHGFYQPSRWHGVPELTNVNVSRTDIGGMNAIQIVTAHRIQFATSTWDESEEKRAVIDALFEIFHDNNKAVLRDLLTDEVRAKIKLN
jgi:uncharacterized protein (TIGR04255 family)